MRSSDLRITSRQSTLQNRFVAERALHTLTHTFCLGTGRPIVLRMLGRHFSVISRLLSASGLGCVALSLACAVLLMPSFQARSVLFVLRGVHFESIVEGINQSPF
jgi:hypothetical protein